MNTIDKIESRRPAERIYCMHVVPGQRAAAKAKRGERSQAGAGRPASQRAPVTDDDGTYDKLLHNSHVKMRRKIHGTYAVKYGKHDKYKPLGRITFL